MRSFCIIEGKYAKRAINNGIIVKKSNILHSKTDCITNLNKISYKSGGAVVFEIYDKIASSEEFDGEIIVSPEDLSIIDPISLGIEDVLAKKAYNYTLNSKMVKTAKLSEKESEVFIKEYNKAFVLAKKENIKNVEKIATMMALKKTGKNAS